jgi:hypothetical protein
MSTRIESYLGRVGRLIEQHASLRHEGREAEAGLLLRRIRSLVSRWCAFRRGT